MAYIGQPPFQEFTSPPTKDSFTGDGSTTTFDLATEVASAGDYALEVFIDNVRQEPGTGKSFTLGNDGSNANKRITFTAAPANGAVIYVLNDKTNLTKIAPTATDLNGVELILDSDADTSITADTDDTIDIKIGGADDFQFTSNTFTALSGSTIKANTIAETTSTSGVTIDGVLLKDGVLGANTVDSAAYVDGSIDLVHMSDNSVDSDQYVDASIDNAHIADDAIDSEHYADGSIDNAHIADDAIDSEHYADGSIDTAHIADNQITLAKMAGGTDGNIISYDASGDPVAIATGSDGQVLTSTGAGSPPAFEDASSFDADAAQVFNESSADVDFRVESNGNANMLFVDGGADRVGIGTGTPDKELDIRKDHNGQTTLRVYNATAGNAAQSQIRVKSNSGLGIISAIDDGFSSTSMYQAGTFSIMAASTSTGGLLLATESDHPIRFYQGAAEKCRITSAGLTFGGDTAAANALDDYEEGTFTPTVDSGTMSGVTGTYTKIGNMVRIDFNLSNFSDKTTNSDIIVSGLPFAMAVVSANVGTGRVYQVSNHTMGVGLAYHASTSVKLHDQHNPSSHARIQYDDLGGDPNMAFYGIYKTSA